MVPTNRLSSTPANRAKHKILCVDDQPSSLLALEASLSDDDLEIISATSGKEALQKLRTQNIALIVLDMKMPEMSGIETAQAVRQLARSGATPIIFVTGQTLTEELWIEAYRSGAIDVVQKPFSAHVLRAKIRAFIDVYAEVRRNREAIQLRDEFLAVVSHELRTPITPLHLQLQGFLYMIETGNFDQVTLEKIKQMLELSDSQVSRLSRLVGQILDVPRLASGVMVLEREKLTLADLIEDVLFQLRYEIEASECRIILNLDSHIQGDWDRTRIEQVVINLLVNATKYAAGKPIEISLTQQGDQACLKVKDSGIGIATENHERIFQRFERAVSLKHFGGLGLGLYISRQILELHGGTIDVESESGRGATFTVLLPLSPSQSSHLENQPALSSQQGRQP